MLRMYQYILGRKNLLKKDSITFYPITFYKWDDKCDSAADATGGSPKKVNSLVKARQG